MSAHLLIAGDAYALSVVKEGSRIEVARLEGGARRLLPDGQSVGEASLEAAIQVAEDWLMPHAARLQGQALEVTDATGGLADGLSGVLDSNARAWRVDALEEMFLQLVGIATGAVVDMRLAAHRSFLAHVLLLRELAHHGQVSEIRIV